MNLRTIMMNVPKPKARDTRKSVFLDLYKSGLNSLVDVSPEPDMDEAEELGLIAKLFLTLEIERLRRVVDDKCTIISELNTKIGKLETNIQLMTTAEADGAMHKKYVAELEKQIEELRFENNTLRASSNNRRDSRIGIIFH